jgi:FMN phosphatase YigB (HAD superfamily)
MTPSQAGETWRLHDPKFVGDMADPDRASSPWSGHRWFAYDLVRWMKPTRIVELGTHWGCSFFALAQSVMDARLGTDCHAIDTWEGDPDSGFYGPEPFESFSRILQRWFDTVRVTVHRSTFDDALPSFNDESIDLLHIDGYHAYEAVKHDYDTWLPRLAPNGIVLLHDVNPSSGFESAAYWEELRNEHPGFEFPHNFGLGVLLPKGVSGREYLLSDEFATWRSYYTEKAGNELGHLQYSDQARMIEERDEVIARQTRMIEERDRTIADQTQLINDRDEALTNQARMIEKRDQVIAGQAMTIEDVTRQGDPGLVSEEGGSAGSRPDRPDGEEPRGAITEAVASESSRPSIKQSLLRVGSQAPEPLPTWLLKGRRKWWTVRAASSIEGDDQEPSQSSLDAVKAEQTTEPAAHPGFDAAFYVGFNDDIDFSDAQPFAHYLQSGIREGRPPSRRALAKAALEVREEPGGPFRHQPYVFRKSPEESQVVHQLAQVPLDGYDLVTIDFWHTLVTRTRHAESVKLDSARFMAQQRPAAERGLSGRELYEARLAAESRLATERRTESGWGEYQAKESLLLALEALAPRLDPRTAEYLADETVKREIEIEIAYARLNSEVAAWVTDVADRGIRVCAVSDFYLDADALNRILLSTGFATPLPMIVSCDEGVSKLAQGRLFQVVRERLEVDSDRHLHVGDNQYSDVEMQLTTGGSAILVPDPLAPAEPHGDQGLDSSYVSRLFDLEVRRPERSRPSLRFEDVNSRLELASYLGDRCFAAGEELSLLPTLLVVKAMEEARKAGVPRINYISREGALLRRVHEAVADLVGMPNIEALHLPSSRQATFAPSLDATNEDLHRMWTFYMHQSPNEFLRAIGLDPSRFRSRLEAHGLDPDAKIWSLWEQPAFVSFLEHRSVAIEVEEGLLRQRREAIRYLDSALGTDDVCIVVDTGWRGTIQDNMARLFESREFRGTYLGLLEFLNPQPGNARKSSVGPDANSGDDTAWLEPHVAVIERLLSPPIAPTLSYSGPNGIVLGAPIGYPSARLSAFQDGILAGSLKVAQTYLTLGAEVADLKEAVVTRMRSLILQPSSGAADAFFSSAHSDDFGTSGPDTSVSLSLAAERLGNRIGRNIDPPTLEDLFWPSGLRRAFPIETTLAGWW